MFRKLLLTAAAVALPLASVSAQAAPTRSSSSVAESEGLSAENGGVYLIAGTIFAIILIVLLDSDDDDNETPVSPG